MRKVLVLLLAFAGVILAQNPNPCRSVINSAVTGQVLSANASGGTPPCKWITGGGGGGGVSSFSAGALSPLFTTSVANPTTTPALSFSLSTHAANTVFAGPTSGGAFAPTFRALVAADIPAGFVQTSRAINTTAPLAGGGDLSADRTLTCNVASGTQPGCLSSADWTTFNSKGSGSVTGITATSPLTGGTITTSGSIGCQAASTLQAGCLSATDWNTFNGKGSGTVTSVGVSSPLGGGPITGSGTLTCATCVVASSPGAGIAHFAGGTQTATSSPVALSELATQAADTLVINATGGSASPTAVAMPTSGTNGCAGTSNALSYNTSTHALGCNTISGSGGLTLIEEHTASSSASLDFTSCISSSYTAYLITLEQVLPATNNVNLHMRASTNGGTSYDSGNNYSWARFGFDSGGSGASGGNGVAFIEVIGDAGITNTASNGGASGSYNLYPTPASVSRTQFSGVGAYQNNSGRFNGETSGGSYNSTTNVNAFQFLFSSGNIASGTIRCYGLSK